VLLEFSECEENCETDKSKINQFFYGYYFKHSVSSLQIDFSKFGESPSIQRSTVINYEMFNIDRPGFKHTMVNFNPNKVST
jgi:hypothetical protein